jgi:tetratricopeptide (TPR) repeat protein
MMKRLFITVVICLFSATMLFSQNQSGDFKKTKSKADKRFEMGDYYGALTIYNGLYKLDSLNKELNFNLAVCYFNTRQYKKAETHFSQTSSAVSLELFRYKAAIAHINKKFKKAINYYNGYKIISGEKDLDNEEVKRLINKTTYAQQAIKNARNVTVKNIGTDINTKHDEYVPLISADESMMLFTSRRPGSTGGLLDPNNRPFEDIYVSYNENGFWSTPKQLREGINTPTNDACVGLSADGQGLYIFKTSKDLISGDLYECRMGLDDWEDPIKMGSDINSDYIESSASITIDDKVLYFSSDREGGFGGKDIYKVIRLPNGEWSKAINLGPAINTPQNEDAPFIHSNGKTLYFSSTGHQNMGGYDIFKVELENGKWGIPVNMGYPVNTVQDDIFFVLAADGKVGYYSSSKDGGYGGQDIYKVILKDEFAKLHVLKGYVMDSKEKDKSIPAKITLIENESKKVQGIYKAKAGTGKFIMLVEPDKTYSVIVEASSYYSFTSELEFDIESKEPLQFKLDKKNGNKRDK